jgi:archaellum component FlaG (FlaF/FlaG flagellin family)
MEESINMLLLWKRFGRWSRKHKDALMFVTQIALVLCGIGSIWIIFCMSSQQNRISQGILQETMKMDTITTRAFIALENPVLQTGVSNPIQFVIVIKNVGKSPARNVWECAFTDTDSSNLCNKMMHARTVADRHKNEGVTLVPESSYPRVFHFRDYKLTLQDSLAVIAKNKLFIVGRINYLDIFNADHFVSFCYYYDSYTKRFLVYDKYNDAD